VAVGGRGHLRRAGARRVDDLDVEEALVLGAARQLDHLAVDRAPLDERLDLARLDRALAPAQDGHAVAAPTAPADEEDVVAHPAILARPTTWSTSKRSTEIGASSEKPRPSRADSRAK